MPRSLWVKITAVVRPVLFAIIAAVFFPSVRAADSGVIDDPLPKTEFPISPFEDAEAWNLAVSRSQTITELVGNIAFTPDKQQIAFMSVRGSQETSWQLSIAFYSFQQQAIVKRIQLPGSRRTTGKAIYYHASKAMYQMDDAGIAFSPDGTKLVYGPASVDEGRAWFTVLFLDIAAEKFTAVEIPYELSYGGPTTIGHPTAWPTADTVYFSRPGGAVTLNLDTLKVQSTNQPVMAGLLNAPSHKNLVLEARENGLLATSRKIPYSRLLLKSEANIWVQGGGHYIYDSAVTAWTPDGHYVVLPLAQGARVITLSGSQRPAPQLDFEVGEGLAPAYLDTITKEFSSGARIWAAVYGGRVNPLTEKVIGPVSEDYRGMGYITQVSPKMTFHFSYEEKPIPDQAVLASFQKEHFWNWNLDAYALLKPLTRDSSSKASPTNSVTQSNASEVQRESEQEGNTEREKAKKATAVAPPRVQSFGPPLAIPDLNLEMLQLEPGTFSMGSASGADPYEGPVTRVTISRKYWLGKTEVTQQQWTSIMGNNPSRDRGDNLPVMGVSWDEANQFCEKLTQRERVAGRLPDNYHYSLPTEAQWEYACRAGSAIDWAGTPDSIAWVRENSSGAIHPIASKRPNAWGFYDMQGNVWEWCNDRFGNFPGRPVSDYAGASWHSGAEMGAARVIRGGSALLPTVECRAARRESLSHGKRYNDLGFRLALTPNL